MISFTHFTIEDDSPLYLQIVKHIKHGIIAGTIENQDEMPSRRVLSALVGINPNTIQKAYRLLEDEHIIESRSGAKSYICITPERVSNIRSDMLEGEASAFALSMQKMGLSEAEATELIKRVWTKTSKGDQP